MKLTLERYGGFAAGIRRPPQTVDTSELPPSVSAEAARLVAAARAAPAPPESAAERIRDGMSYSITIDEEPSPTILSQTDGAMSPPFAELLRWLERTLLERR